jgi:uncharacterized caspase-like protein
VAIVAFGCISSASADESSSPLPAAITTPSSAQLAQAARAGSGNGTAGGTQVALVIGNSTYESLPHLANAVNDAQDICTKLRSLRFEATCHFDVPDRIRVREILRSFLDHARQAHAAVFYFVGHGVQVDGENYLLPTKVTPLGTLDLVDEGLALTPFLASLAQIRGANGSGPFTLAIIDAARENTLEGPQFAGVAHGLAVFRPNSPRLLVLFSTTPGKTARATDGRNSLFARDLLQNLGHPGVAVDEEFQRTREQVRRDSALESKTEQVPTIIGMLGTTFCIAGCDRVDPQAVNGQLEEALRRIRELELERERNTRERQESDRLVARLENDVRARETVAASATERDRQREAQLADLRAQLANARSNQRQLEEMGAAVQKAKELQEANLRLSKEKQDALLHIAKLQQEIDSRSQTIGKAGEANRKDQEEIARLRGELDEARSRQRRLEEAEARAKANDVEISSLRATIAQLRSEQMQRERQYAEQQKQRDEEYRMLQQALKESAKSEAPAGGRPTPPPMPAGF